MHELAVAVQLVELACEHAERHGLARVLAVHVRVGPLSGIVREALLFSFDVAAAGTALDGAALKVEDASGAELELIGLEVAE